MKKEYKMKETPTIKLTGRFSKTFRVEKKFHFKTPRDPTPLDYCFEWDDGEEETRIRVSLHAAKKLTEVFEKFGYKQIR